METETWLLAGFVFLILALAVFVSGRSPILRKSGWWMSAAGCLAVGIAAITVLLKGQTMANKLWEVAPGVELVLTVDAKSAFFLAVMAMTSFPVSLYAASYYRDKAGIRVHGALFVLFLAAMTMVFIAGNGWTFLIAWETMSLLSFGLVVFDHEKSSVRRAGFIYAVMTHFGTLFLMIGFAFMYAWTGSFDFQEWSAVGSGIAAWKMSLIFLLAFIGFGTKAGIVPLHVWLPKAHPAAPAPVSALMSALMIKAGLYGIVRVVWDWFQGGEVWWGGVLLIIGMVTGLMGALYGTIQNDMKQLLAYSSVENMGILFMLLGTAVISASFGSEAVSMLAAAGFFLHVLNHAVFKALLFLGVGSVQHGAGTVQLNRLGGLIRTMPLTSGLFLAGAAGLAAIPMFSGFVGEWIGFQSFLGGIMAWPAVWKGFAVAAAAALAMIGAIAAAGMMKAFGIAFLGKPRTEQSANSHEAPSGMLIGMSLLSAGVLLGGLFPSMIWNWIKPAAVGWISGGSVGIPGLREWVWSTDLTKGTAGLTGTGSIAVASYALAALFVAVLVPALVRIFFGPSRIVKEETWGCGHSLNEKMEYTATSLTYPLLMFFSWFFQPQRVVIKSLVRGKDAGIVTVQTEIRRLIEQGVYAPLIRMAIGISSKAREIQNGRIQLYLAYVFATILVLLVVYTLR
ncbi:proton-conducting transporter transmembrane domain-containing protein [Ferviditalea candida]|uniref:Proton-conducting transporter membrane subunit n=1 Tax=Ferviditalea candida TaxID=3108399 RepID=A0ABU5ZI23_9BACL|nr:proton-conducting transporter membrane subunit [Paenibacillaceae bacterium T2]